MRPSPSIEPFTPSPDVSLPHPVLRAALDNLDVQLEEELVRYRRQRRLQSDQYQSNSYQSKLSADLSKPMTAQSRSFTVGGAALGNRPIARRVQTGLELPKFNTLSPEGEFPIGNSADTENPVKSILGSSIAPQRAASRFSQVPVQPDRVPFAKMPSVKMPPFAPVEAAPVTAYQSEPYQSEPYQSEPYQPALEEQPLASAIGITSYAQQPELSAYAPSATLQKLAHEQYEHNLPDPEGYLESSEELLKSIEEEMPLRARRRADLLDLLLTPLGVGLMLLLLLSTATLGFLIMNPGTVSALFSPGSNVAASPSPSSPLNSPLTRVPTTRIDSAPPSPDLSAEEFRDVNLNTLSTLPSGSSAAAQRSAQQRDRANEHSVAQAGSQAGSQAPAQAGSSAPAQAGSNAAPATPQPNLPTVPVQSQPAQAKPESIPVYSPPTYTQPPYSPPAYNPPPYNPSPAASPSSSPTASPSPTGSPALPTHASPSASRPIDVPPPDSASSNIATAPPSSASAPQSPAAQDYYYVGTDYNGNSSLQEARQTVPDAYVRNLPSGGAIVQAGAFSSKSAAEERVQELQQQGLPAQIYRH